MQLALPQEPGDGVNPPCIACVVLTGTKVAIFRLQWPVLPKDTAQCLDIPAGSSALAVIPAGVLDFSLYAFVYFALESSKSSFTQTTEGSIPSLLYMTSLQLRFPRAKVAAASSRSHYRQVENGQN